MPVLDEILANVRARQARVVFPELQDDRVRAAAERLEREGICVPLGIGGETDLHVEALIKARGMKENIARRLLRKPLYRAAAMVAVGEADAMAAGAKFTSRRVVEAASMVVGLSPQVKTLSSFFLMVFDDRPPLIFSDCAINVAPDARALAEIAQASAKTGQALLGKARVALLSFSTGRSGTGDSVDLMRKVAKITGFTGPVQADAALNPVVAARKGMGSGDANVLVFPSLDAGNIAYKLCTELAGAQAIGPVLQGMRRPVCDLSRGSSIDEIVATTAVTLALG